MSLDGPPRKGSQCSCWAYPPSFSLGLLCEYAPPCVRHQPGLPRSGRLQRRFHSSTSKRTVKSSVPNSTSKGSPQRGHAVVLDATGLPPIVSEPLLQSAKNAFVTREFRQRVTTQFRLAPRPFGVPRHGPSRRCPRPKPSWSRREPTPTGLAVRSNAVPAAQADVEAAGRDCFRPNLLGCREGPHGEGRRQQGLAVRGRVVLSAGPSWRQKRRRKLTWRLLGRRPFRRSVRLPLREPLKAPGWLLPAALEAVSAAIILHDVGRTSDRPPTRRRSLVAGILQRLP